MNNSRANSNSPPKPDCDVVVIGAGIGGLTTGALLAKAGLDVQIFESHSKPGGYLATFEREGFHFDAAIHWLNLCGRGQVIHNLLEFVAGDGPQFEKPERIRRYKSSEFDYTLTSDPDELRQELKRDFPGDSSGIDAFFNAADKVGRAFSAFSKRMRTPATMGWLEAMSSGIRVAKDSFPLWKYSGIRAEKGLDRFFSDPILKDMFASEELLISCLMPVGWAYTDNYQLVPTGGSRTLTNWVSRSANTFGARIHCNTKVTRITTDGGAAIGVEYQSATGDSGAVSCPYVVAANDIISVLTNLLDAGTLPQSYIQKQTGADLYGSAFTVSLGLNVKSESLGFDESLITLTNNGQTKTEHTSGDPAKSCLSILARSVSDKTLAPPGKGTITIFAQADLDYRNKWLTGPESSRDQAYQDLKEEYAQVLIDRTAGALCPQLREHIELIDIATPITYWRYTGNHLGSMMGQRPTKRNIYGRLARYDTPIKGLYRAGHWAEYGGGVPSAVRSAANTSLHILKLEKSAMFKQLARVLDECS